MCNATDLNDRLKAIGSDEGGAMWFGKPDRWYESPTWRCTSDHVSKRFLKTDRGDLCLACGESVVLTFPEDIDGPLKTSGGEGWRQHRG